MTDDSPARASIFASENPATIELPYAFADQSEPENERPVRGRRALGIGAVVIVAALGIVEGVAVGLGANGEYATSTALAWVVIVGTVVTLLLGALAAIANRGRWWGLAAVVLSIAVNPISLMGILDFFATISTT